MSNQRSAWTLRLTELSFDAWLDHAFSHGVRFQRNTWFFDPDHDWWDPQPVVAVAYLTRLFKEAEQSVYWFSDEQIAQGLTYLLNTSASGDNGWYSSTTPPIEDRVRGVGAVADLFSQLFAPRCKAQLSHLRDSESVSLNIVCYMWWDEFPCIALPDDPNRDLLTETALRTMESILGLPSLACQESALHGLGHWQRTNKAEVMKIIDRFLDASPQTLDSRISNYAKSARSGCVL